MRRTAILITGTTVAMGVVAGCAPTVKADTVPMSTVVTPAARSASPSMTASPSTSTSTVAVQETPVETPASAEPTQTGVLPSPGGSSEVATLSAPPTATSSSGTTGPITGLTPGPIPPVTTGPTSTETPTPTQAPKPITMDSLADLGIKGKVVALTFDDGPTNYTYEVLAILKDHGVRATFFEIGEQVDDIPRVSADLTRAGMSVQSHTYRHINMATASTQRIQAELTATSTAIKKATGIAPTCVRPPMGAIDKQATRLIYASGASVVLWNDDPQDWRRPGTQAIISQVMSQVRPGSIILMHDGGGYRQQTIAALPVIIKRLQAQGYSFVTLCQPPH